MAAALLTFGVTAQSGTRDGALMWTTRAAKPLATLEPGGNTKSLQFLTEVVGKARIVALGEAVHGGHELLTLRNLLFEYLVRTEGFTAIAVETGFADSIAIDDYVMGRGEMTPALAAAAFSFAAPRALAENKALLEWIRAYNASAQVKRKIRFYGLDMAAKPAATGQSEVGRGISMALEYVATVAPDGAARFKQRLEPLFAKISAAPYEVLSRTEKDAITVSIADLIALFERRHVEWVEKTSSLAYERAYRNAVGARHLDADLRAGGWWIGTEGDIDQRDAAQADQVRWALEREGPRGRLLVFAYDGHVRAGPYVVADPNFTSMGQHLRARYGKDFVTIGTVAGAVKPLPDGKEPAQWDAESINGLLAQVGRPAFLVDLRALPPDGDAATWWDRARTLQSGKFIYQLNPVACFDALIFIDRVTRAVTVELDDHLRAHCGWPIRRITET